jgi:hypothetical protein
VSEGLALVYTTDACPKGMTSRDSALQLGRHPHFTTFYLVYVWDWL